MRKSTVLIIGLILTVLGLAFSYHDNSDPLAIVFGIPGVLILLFGAQPTTSRKL
jgi:hypothetical protein